MSELRMRTAEARALIRGATDAAFFDLLVSRRRAVSVGDAASAALYASAVSAAKRVFGAASDIWLRVRERASARRRPGGDDPAELAELRAAAEAKLKSSTDGSERARLIRAVADLRRKEHDKRAEARGPRGDGRGRVGDAFGDFISPVLGSKSPRSAVLWIRRSRRCR